MFKIHVFDGEYRVRVHNPGEESREDTVKPGQVAEFDAAHVEILKLGMADLSPVSAPSASGD